MTRLGMVMFAQSLVPCRSPNIVSSIIMSSEKVIWTASSRTWLHWTMTASSERAKLKVQPWVLHSFVSCQRTSSGARFCGEDRWQLSDG